MLRRRPEFLAVVISLFSSLVILLAFGIDISLSRKQELRSAEERLAHFSHLLAEHNTRALESVDILLREIATDLSQTRHDWREWNINRGWNYAAQRHSRALPQLRSIAVFDENGDQRFISTMFPPPQINIRDRDYFKALAGGQEYASQGPYVGRNTGRYTFALTHRIVDKDGAFAGVAFAALELSYFQNFCWPNRPSNDFDAVLTNAEGKVIASCRPVDISEESSVISQPAHAVLANSKLRDIPLQEIQVRRDGYLAAIVPLQSRHGLFVVAVMPENTALAAWSHRLQEFSILAGSIIVLLLSGAWLVRRQVRSLREAQAHLKARRSELQAAVEKATTELATEKEAAELASTAKTRFLAAASHDLRQPLHALSLFSADLQRQLRTGSAHDLDRLADQIANSTNSLGEMLDALLDVSRLDLGGIETHLEPAAVQLLFNRLQMAFRRAAAARGISLHFRPSSLHAHTDVTLIERLVANLLSNSIRYTHEGGRILVAARHHGNFVDIEIRDSGIGIAPEHHAMVFKEFYQVGNTAREQKKGLGLGLSIVDRIARTLNTPITLRSRSGAGTTVRVRLPWCEPLIAETETAPPIIFIGREPELESTSKAISAWGQPCRLLNDVQQLGVIHNQAPAIVFTSALAADLLRARLPLEWPVVAVGTRLPKDGIHILQTPVRPAKLRALVQQLQKTLSKSIR